MNIAGPAHTNWRVRDVERSLRFYRDVLGLEPFGLEEHRRGERSPRHLGDKGQKEVPGLSDLGPKMPHQEKVPLTCRRGEEAYGGGDILDRTAGLLIQ